MLGGSLALQLLAADYPALHGSREVEFDYGMDGNLIGAIKNIFAGIGKDNGRVVRIVITKRPENALDLLNRQEIVRSRGSSDPRVATSSRGGAVDTSPATGTEVRVISFTKARNRASSLLRRLRKRR